MLILIALAVGAMGQGPLDGYPRNRPFDIKHYVFAINLNKTPEIEVEARVDFSVVSEFDTLWLDLYYERDTKKGMKVSRVFTSDNVDVPFEQREHRLFMNLERMNLAKGSVSRVFITYEGKPIDGLIITENKFAQPTIFGDNWPNRARHWLSVIDHPSEKATHEFILQVPKGMQSISNGEQTNVIFNPDSSSLQFWSSSVNLPSKVMVIGVSNFSIKESGMVGEIPVTSWVYPDDSATGHTEYAAAVPILEFMDSLVAPYPYKQLANVQSTTRYGGMENAGCIFYHENSTKGDGSSEELIAHEIAHQWFGNSASEADWFHLWLSEGFATYLAAMYLQYKYGEERFNKVMDKAAERIMRYHSKSPGPVIDTTIKDLNGLLNPYNYQRGSWVLHTIRGEVGDTLFGEVLKRYYTRYQMSNAYTNDFIRVVSEIAERDMAPFINPLLWEAGYPKVDLVWNKSANTIKAKRLDKSSASISEINLRFVGSENQALVLSYSFEALAKGLKVKSPFEVVDIEVEPNYKQLRTILVVKE